MLASVLFGALFALSGVAMALGCWYAWRALHPGSDDPPADAPADG